MRHRPATRRNAVTLLEILLVLALLVMLSAMTWPALDRPMANQRLRKAADMVRTSWARARIDAMSTGHTGVFRCTIESNRFEIAAQAGPEVVDGSETGSLDQFDRYTSDSDVGTGTAQTTASRQFTLPEDIRFAGGQTEFDSRAAFFGGESQEAAPVEGEWSEPILFYPDGTTSTATLILENGYERRIRISIRGLTGVIVVGETYPVEEETDDLAP